MHRVNLAKSTGRGVAAFPVEALGEATKVV